MNKKYGADPEIFAVYNEDDKQFVLPPAFFRTDLKVHYEENGTHPIFLRTNKSSVIEDGVAFELNVDPEHNWEDLFDTIQHTYQVLENNILCNFTGHCDGKVHVLPTVEFDCERWSGRSEEFKQCLIFGCDPDQDAFNMEAKAKVLDVQKHPKRYGGGHIHFSGSPIFEIEPILSVKCFALTVGQAAIAFSDVPELEHQRTFLYGRPGKYRVQYYPDDSCGIEYRTPSNRWTSNKAFAAEIFRWADICIDILLETQLGLELLYEMEEDAKRAIIETDVTTALQILDRIEERI